MRDSSCAKFLSVGEIFQILLYTFSLTELVKANITRYDFSEGISTEDFYSGGPPS